MRTFENMPQCKQQGKRLSIHEKNLIRAYYAFHVPIKTTAVQQWVTEQFGHTLHITTIRRILRDTRKIETNNIQEESAKGREALVGTKRNAKRTSLSGQGAKESISFKNELLSFMKVVRREKHILTVPSVISARAMLHQIADDRNGAIRTGFAGVFWKKYHDYPLYDILNAEIRKSSRMDKTQEYSDRITAELTCRADGDKLPILLIVHGKPGGLIDQTGLGTYPSGHYYDVQESGRMESRIWDTYLDMLPPYIDGPTVILSDNVNCS
ncbi:hypothetical protein DYB35_002354 [Aphanomyces astaci]|uniref:DDE-1 domain-containing protein n=1 Tax=Aphanomyces astaci TaxID=112090 RepID=A0A418DFV0_APHAT|nr:hypothetical protein DYB35_002354 [Aphanomyces astaci]